jgi:hypothetical protein
MAGAFLAGGPAALIAAFTAIPLPEAETVSDPQGRSAAEDGSRATILLRDAKPGWPQQKFFSHTNPGHPGGGK